VPVLKDSPLAVMFWAGDDPKETLETLVSFGVRHGQLGIPGDFSLAGAAAGWKSAAKLLEFEIYTVFAAYDGESYADVATVRETVGFVPPATRAAREARTVEVSRFAHEIGAPAIATHIGCVPPKREGAALYEEIVGMVQRLCDRAAEFCQNFALETGQETAAELLELICDVNRPNLGINFDPGNMILYGTGEPVEALQMLQAEVLSVHCKDGKWPAAPGALGVETPLGKGDVHWVNFLTQLQTGGYRGPLAVEREEPDAERRVNDIRHGLNFLQRLQLSDG
jgi:L-ribulose-5-phosphate 3-epimerase